jgi:hypothetical protein
MLRSNPAVRIGLGISLLATSLVPMPTVAQQREPVDLAMLAKIRDEGMQRSQAMEHVIWLSDVYNSRTHHSNMDVVDRVQRNDLKQAATVAATFAYLAAMRDEKLPRKPVAQGGRGAGNR